MDALVTLVAGCVGNWFRELSENIYDFAVPEPYSGRGGSLSVKKAHFLSFKQACRDDLRSNSSANRGAHACR